MATIAEIAKKLNKEFGDNTLAIKADITPTYERMSTGAFGLDYPLFGGLVYGRIVTFAGLFHSGKTTAACLALGAYQRANPDKTCVYVDVEHSLDLKFQARMNGVDFNKLIYFNPKTLTGEQVLDSILEFQKADDIGMIVLDSIPALLPSQSMENDIEKDPGMRGTIAKPMHRFLIAMSNLVNQKNNILLLINQVRNTLSTDLDWQYDEAEEKLYLYAQYPLPTSITIQYIPEFKDVSEVYTPYWISYLKRLSVAYTKETEGRIRSKYTLNSGTYNLDGNTLLSEATSELQQIRTELNENINLNETIS